MAAAFVLIVLWNTGTHSVTMQEFNSRETCEAARLALAHITADRYPSLNRDGEVKHALRQSVCVQK